MHGPGERLRCKAPVRGRGATAPVEGSGTRLFAELRCPAPVLGPGTRLRCPAPVPGRPAPRPRCSAAAAAPEKGGGRSGAATETRRALRGFCVIVASKSPRGVGGGGGYRGPRTARPGEPERGQHRGPPVRGSPGLSLFISRQDEMGGGVSFLAPPPPRRPRYPRPGPARPLSRPGGARRGPGASASSGSPLPPASASRGGGEEESLLQFKFHGICSLLYSADFYMDS